MKKFVLYSTILMLFSDRLHAVFFSVNLYAAYVIVIVNTCLLLLMGKLWFPRGLLLLLSWLVLGGISGLMLGVVSPAAFAKDFIGIVPNAIYACAFIRFIRYDVESFFEEYARFAYYVAIIGLILSPIQLGTGLQRLTSIMQEPSSFCVVCVPALFYYADQWQRHGRYRLRFFVLLAVCTLTFSSVGYVTMLFALYLFGTRFRFGTMLAPVVVVVSALGVYAGSEFFRLRLDDTLMALRTASLYDTNLSSYGVAKSVFVTGKAFQEHPLTGGGLGSYVIAHDRFAPSVIGNEIFEDMGMGELARWDASSLLLRIIAEFGLLGFLACAFFLIRYFPWHSTAGRRAVALALLCYLFSKAVRSGTYFDPEEWLFFVTYGVNGMMARKERKVRERLAVPRSAETTSSLTAGGPQPAY